MIMSSSTRRQYFTLRYALKLSIVVFTAISAFVAISTVIKYGTVLQNDSFEYDIVIEGDNSYYTSGELVGIGTAQYNIGINEENRSDAADEDSKNGTKEETREVSNNTEEDTMEDTTEEKEETELNVDDDDDKVTRKSSGLPSDDDSVDKDDKNKKNGAIKDTEKDTIGDKTEYTMEDTTEEKEETEDTDDDKVTRKSLGLPSDDDSVDKDDENDKNETIKDTKNPHNSGKIIDSEKKRNETSSDENEEAHSVNEDEIVIQHDPSKLRLNILLLYPDDWRHDSIGSEKPYVLTPFLDSLAKEGIRFTQNAVTTSVCWMSRATLWMGQYASRHKSYNLKCPWFAIPDNWKHSWVYMLQRSGYYTGHIGKWQYHTQTTSAFFDWAYIFEGTHWEIFFGNRRVHAADVCVEKAAEFFKKRPKDKPFTLSIAFYPPKPVGLSREPGGQFSPTNETKKLYENVTIPLPETYSAFSKLPDFLQRGAGQKRFYERYRTMEHYQASMRNYYALVTGVDKASKEIVDMLKKEGLYNNTMIIFTTDNGMFHGSHGLAGKWYPYQESIRVPLIIYDPRMPKDKVGTLDDSFTLNVDLAETILGAAGVKPNELMQGRDISDLYMPNNKKDKYHDSFSVKSQPWREDFFYEFPYDDERSIPSSTALIRKKWKYINWPRKEREQLFNLEEDPLEVDDLYNRTDAKTVSFLQLLRKRHDKLRQKLHDPLYWNSTGRCGTWKKLYPNL